MKTPNSKIWENVHASRNWGKYPPEELVRFIANNFSSINKEDRKKISILDVGCGQGAGAWFLAREGFSVTGVDISPSAVAKSRDYLASDGLKAEFLVADFKNIKLPAESFDCIVDIESIYTNTAADISKIYYNMYQLLKPGGTFFTMSFGTECSNFGTGTKLEEHTYTNIPVGSPSTGIAHYFDKDELRVTFIKAGFDVMEINKKTVSRSDGKEIISQWVAYGVKK